MGSLEKLKSVAFNKTLLYIESDRVLQKNFGIYLQKIFKNFHQAYDGQEGFELFLKVKPDVVMMDLDLLKKDSIALIVDMQELNEDIIILTLSKSGDNYNLLQSLDMGLSGMLLKPIACAQLVDKLTRVLPAAQKVISPKVEKVKPIEKKIAPKVQEIVKEKIVEKPKEVVKETIKKETKIEPKLKMQVPKTCIEDIEEFVKKREDIILVSNYKGITIQNKGKFLNFSGTGFTIEASVAQMIAANYERHIIIKVVNKNKFIYAHIINIDLKNNQLKLVKPHYINYKQRDADILRLTPDKSFQVTMFFNKRHIDFKAKQLSSKHMLLVTDILDLDIKPQMQLDLTFGFDIASPSVLIKERKFTKTFAKAIVQRVETTNSGLQIVVAIELQKSGQSSFLKYLKQRENETIAELKKIIKR